MITMTRASDAKKLRPGLRRQRPAYQAADHVQFTMREIHDAHQAKNEREPQSRQRIERAGDKAVREQLKKEIHRGFTNLHASEQDGLHNAAADSCGPTAELSRQSISLADRSCRDDFRNIVGELHKHNVEAVCLTFRIELEASRSVLRNRSWPSASRIFSGSVEPARWIASMMMFSALYPAAPYLPGFSLLAASYFCHEVLSSSESAS